MTVGARLFGGWTLAEARERCVEPALLDAHAKARDAWVAAGSPSRFVRSSPWSENDNNAKSRRERLLYQQHNMTFRDIQRALQKLLLDARLVAWGRRESPLCDPRPIPPSAWNALVILDGRRSVVHELTPAKVRIHDIRVYPVLEAPDAGDHLASMSLVEAFREYILDDPEVARLRQSIDGSDTRPGWSPLHGKSRWPLAHTWHSGEVIAAGGIPRFDPPMRNSERAVYHAVLLRLYRLLQLLSTGRLVATGVPAGPAIEARVPHSVWTHAAYVLDVEDGDLLEETTEPQALASLANAPRWRALMLSSPTSSSVAVHAPNGEWVEDGVLTAGERSILELVKVLFPNGTANIRPGDRNRRITEAQKRAGHGVVGDSTIKRCFTKIAFERK